MLKIDDYMFPCLNKKLFGVDCLGCGIQRAVVLLFKGEFTEAFNMYPAIYTLLLLTFFLIFNMFYRFKGDVKIKTGLIVINVIIIITSYIIKMNQLN